MGTNYQFIDTTTNIIEGYEPEKNSVKIDLMREGIKEGHDFPAVEMVKTGKNAYQLLYGITDVSQIPNCGGHHRSIAHVLEGAPLKIKLYSEHRSPGYVTIKFNNVRETALTTIDADSSLLDETTKHFPKKTIEDICNKYTNRD